MVANLTSLEQPSAFQKKLRTKRFGRIALFRSNVDSTNEWAKKLADNGAEEGTITVAARQTKGKGRLRRKWISPKGGLWFSIVLHPDIEASQTAKLVFLASLAVAQVLRRKYDVKTETKWPNDVLVSERKICGILAESSISDCRLSYVVLGVGINANFNPDEFLNANDRSRATSIENELGRKISLLDLLCDLLEELERLYDFFKTRGFDRILEGWKKLANFLKHKVVLHSESENVFGRALDVDNQGALVIELESGELTRFFTGDLLILA